MSFTEMGNAFVQLAVIMGYIENYVISIGGILLIVFLIISFVKVNTIHKRQTASQNELQQIRKELFEIKQQLRNQQQSQIENTYQPPKYEPPNDNTRPS